ncbi:glycosyltransferase [Thermodesulfobacterium sp. TA1]|uniref:glycosyltransferase n=1 Tax=Thermodesulfobacterium sp. TA1 TaxID=2234087 RepID=UPI001231D89F|nr:glycosyltransferase [Thermodesulfobacterium sp. TA1]QER41947.1 glycosyltransferase [Thermodesulfobacterium sp. TA1]
MFLIPHLWSGGAERVLKNLTDGLRDYENYIVLFENVVKYNVNGELVILNSLASKNLVKKLINLPIRYYKIRKLKKEIKPYAVVSLLEPANFYNAITKLKNQKVILSLHSNYTTTFKEDPFFGDNITRKILFFVYKLVFKIFYNKADYIVAVSKDVALDAVRSFGMNSEKVVVIYNPYPIENIEELAKEDLGWWERVFEGPVIITAGRLTKQKGQWYLLRVFRQLKETYKDLKLVILGEGELKEYLVTLSEELGLRTFVWDRDSFSEDFDVYFLGFQKNPFKFIARSKLFVFPSLWEGFPNALVEAMACGVPVVSSDCRSGPREILAPNTDVEYQTEKPEFAEYGVLMPVFDVKFKSAKEPLEEKERMWVEILEKLIKDEELRKAYSIKGKQRAEDFSLEKIVEEWKRLIEGV